MPDNIVDINGTVYTNEDVQRFTKFLITNKDSLEVKDIIENKSKDSTFHYFPISGRKGGGGKVTLTHNASTKKDKKYKGIEIGNAQEAIFLQKMMESLYGKEVPNRAGFIREMSLWEGGMRKGEYD